MFRLACIASIANACFHDVSPTPGFVVIPVPPNDFGALGLPLFTPVTECAHERNPRLIPVGHMVARGDKHLLAHHC